jgi:hypothetical protein
VECDFHKGVIAFRSAPGSKSLRHLVAVAAHKAAACGIKWAPLLLSGPTTKHERMPKQRMPSSTASYKCSRGPSLRDWQHMSATKLGGAGWGLGGWGGGQGVRYSAKDTSIATGGVPRPRGA